MSVDLEQLHYRGQVWNACVQGRAADLKEQLQALPDNVAIGNLADRHGFTGVHLAATHGHNECISLLLDAKACVDKASSDGTTPLMCAVRADMASSVRQLLESGGEVSHRAVLDGARGRPDCLALLLASERGASFAGLAHEGKTPLALAEQEGHKDCVDQLRAAVAATAASRKRAAEAEAARDEVVFKLAYGSGLRRSTPTELSMKALRASAAGAFELAPDALRFTYTDDEGDEITIATDRDVCEAAAYARSRGPSATLKVAVHAG